MDSVTKQAIFSPIAPLMTLQAFSRAMGLELTVFQAQVNRGYWPTIKVGKRVFVNVEAVRLMAQQRFEEMSV